MYISSSEDIPVTHSTLQNIVFKNGYCSGGHGLSIGSVGGRSDNTVSDVTFETSTVINSDNGKFLEYEALFGHNTC